MARCGSKIISAKDANLLLTLPSDCLSNFSILNTYQQYIGNKSKNFAWLNIELTFLSRYKTQLINPVSEQQDS